MKTDPVIIKTINEHDAELMLLRALLIVLVSDHPNKTQLKTKFQSAVGVICQNAPNGTDPEMIVEIRARALVYLQLLS